MYYRIDIGHPKQARQARIIIDRLGIKPDQLFISARGALGVPEVAKALGLDPLLIGGYYGDLHRKLVDDLLRAKRLADFVQVFADDAVLITFGMPSGIRVAFGLKIPIIHVNDTPHNEPVRRLTAALSDYILTPLPEVKNWKDTPARRAVIGYYGVPEMAYVQKAEELMPGRPLERAKEIVEEWSPFIFMRYAEWKASYGVGNLREFYELFETVYKIARSYGYNIVLYRRYANEQVSREGVYVIGDGVVNMPYLIRHAAVAVTSGGSLTKEAALQGVPTIVTHYRLDQTERLRREGFPIYPGHRDLVGILTELLESKRNINVPSLEKYEKVDEVVKRCLEIL